MAETELKSFVLVMVPPLFILFSLIIMSLSRAAGYSLLLPPGYSLLLPKTSPSFFSNLEAMVTLLDSEGSEAMEVSINLS